MILFSIVILFVCLFIGTPVPVSFMAVALYGLIVGDHDPSFLIPYGASKLGAVILFSIPLFIIAGGIIERGSIGSKIVDSVQKPFARIKGGLGVILVVSCAVFGSITGSACATLSCIGSIMFPKMEKAGFSKAHTATLLANAAPLGMLIPPSGIVILYSWLSGQSVLAGFLSTVVPGIILTILFALINVYLVKDDPNVTIELPSSNPILLKEKKRCSSALPALFLPVIILGGIYGGVITTVEAASVSVVYAIVVGYFYYKELTWNAIKESLVDGATVTG
ncbi:TRAP transporter large permease subunit, partial [Cloacibacillus evryensis]